jgi:hypothetical protein
MTDASHPVAAPSTTGLAGLSPAYFGMVMATGIVSIAAHLLGHPLVARALFALNLVAYAVLCLLYLLRALRHPQRFFGDLFDHLRGPGFFTSVAATSIVGSQFLLLTDDSRVAGGLWAAGGRAVGHADLHDLHGPHDQADQAVAGQGHQRRLAAGGGRHAVDRGLSRAARRAWASPVRLELNFLALSMWLWGGMLYIWMMSLIFYRYTFFTLEPRRPVAALLDQHGRDGDLDAGGVAAHPQLARRAVPAVGAALPEGVHGVLLGHRNLVDPDAAGAGVWRHVYRRFPLRYDPLYWGAVFPLGMYAASTERMIEAMGIGFLDAVPRVFFPIAVAAWCAAFLGLVSGLLGRARHTAGR